MLSFVHHETHPYRLNATELTADSPATRLFLLPYVTAVFLGAGLLFSLEPMVGKLVLPRLGGVPAVWNTCLLFFQGMLLAGYAYAHYGVRMLGVKRHAALHAALLIISLALLPVSIQAGDPPTDASPAGWLLLALLRSIGLPFLVLSATAPLVQYWLAGTRHRASRDPYFLYAASNLGSLAGLAVYPLVLEPLIGLRVQAVGWTFLYVAFAGVMGLLAWYARAPLRDSEPPADAQPVPVLTGLKWAGIAFIPSALLLTVTGYVTTDIAPMPLLWLLPLGLYLATFVFAFATRTERHARAMRIWQPVATLMLAVVVIVGLKQLWLLPLHLVVLTLVSYLAHARLAAERPHTSDLTTFYLWISVGGTLGGVFGAIVAPLLLMPEFEYILLLPVALLVPGRTSISKPLARSTLLIGLAILGALGLIGALLDHPGWSAVITGTGAIALLLRRIDHGRLPLTFAAAMIIVIFAIAAREFVDSDTLFRERNFFGTLRVTRGTESHRLIHGRIIHGAQLTDAGEFEIPTTYYTREGPLGDVFRTLMPGLKAARIAVVGLGVGTVACYARPGDSWDMLEINPAVVRIATDPRLFTYMQRCAPDARILIGDGRRTLQLMTDARYDFIMLDAFSSDAVPAHLLTREAFALYFARLKPGGFLAVQVSNRFLDLAPVVAANAAALGVFALARDDDTSNPPRHTPSRWIALAADRSRLDPLAHVSGWNRLIPKRGFRTWTDDYTSLLPVMRMLHVN